MKRIEYDYSELRGDIRRVFGTNKEFAEAIGMAESTLSLKLNNNAEWSQEEMTSAIALLGVGPWKIKPYFFTPKV